MKFVLFGANGAIGTLVMNEALKDGNEVVAYVRRENAITMEHTNLTVVVGDLQNESLIEDIVKDSDIVISALGPYMETTRKVSTTPISDGYDVVFRAMKKHNKKRFIALGTPTIKGKDHRNDFNNTVFPTILKLLFPVTHFKTKRMGKVISNSGLDWTLVRFLDPKGKHKNRPINVTLDGTTKKIQISREHIANFIYSVAKNNLYIQQMPTISHT